MSDLVSSGPIVLFFYPRAMTSGCSAESCHFRDLKDEFAAHGAHAVGISVDSVEIQSAFDKRHNLGMTLLSDPDREIAALVGAKRLGPIWNKRQTYVIDQSRTILAIISSEMDMEAHADEALAFLAGTEAVAT